MQFNGHAKNVTCHMCYMSSVTHVTCHKYKVEENVILDPCVIYFWKADGKCSSMVMLKMSHVTCITCHMLEMLHVTNIKLQRILQNIPCVIYFCKADSKCSSMVILKTSHVTCVTCHMSKISRCK